MKIFSVVLFCSVVVICYTAVNKQCVSHGLLRHIGDSWVSDDPCNACDCTQFGAECNTWRNCDNAAHKLGQPGDSLCKYGNGYKKVGQMWQAQDGCNTCNCTSDGMVCTFKPCKNSGFDHPLPASTGGQFMDCPYQGSYYKYGSHFLATDGCNTCLCVMPGNYATFPICTTTKCNLIG